MLKRNNDIVPNGAKVTLQWRKHVKNRISSEHLHHPVFIDCYDKSQSHYFLQIAKNFLLIEKYHAILGSLVASS